MEECEPRRTREKADGFAGVFPEHKYEIRKGLQRVGSYIAMGTTAQYMRKSILGNFSWRLLAVEKTEDDLQRPSVLVSLIRQHISMDLTQGIRAVWPADASSGPVSSLHSFEKPAEQRTGWYLENTKDTSGAEILFAPIQKCFKSTRPVGGYLVDSVTEARELQALVRIFGGSGVDKLERMLKEHTAALLNCIDTSLGSNREVLELVASKLQPGDRIERVASIKQIVDMETVNGLRTQAGGLNNNIFFLARCIIAVVAGSEYIRLDREHEQRQPFLNGDAGGTLNCEPYSLTSGEASIKPTMQLFVKRAAGIILDSWSEANSSHPVAQRIFLDQLCEVSPNKSELDDASDGPRVVLAAMTSLEAGYSQATLVEGATDAKNLVRCLEEDPPTTDVKVTVKVSKRVPLTGDELMAGEEEQNRKKEEALKASLLKKEQSKASHVTENDIDNPLIIEAEVGKTVNGLQLPKSTNIFSKKGSYRDLSEIAEQAKKRAEIAISRFPP